MYQYLVQMEIKRESYKEHCLKNIIQRLLSNL